MIKNNLIHPTSIIEGAQIAADTRIAPWVIILPGTQIGKAGLIEPHCFIESNVTIGNGVKVMSGVYIGKNVKIAGDVTIGPNVSIAHASVLGISEFPQEPRETVIEAGVSIEPNVVLYSGIRVGANAQIKAGSVVTKSVPPGSIVDGSPAKISGYINNVVYQEGIYKSISGAINPSGSRVQKIGVGDAALHILKLVEDMRGNLSVGQFLDDIPFIPKRYFLILNVPSTEARGEHAHKKCKQFLICIEGQCSVVVDDGNIRKEVLLNAPNKGLYIPEYIWGIQYKYSADAKLLVFASEYYEESDYIRDYTQFMDMRQAYKKKLAS